MRAAFASKLYDLAENDNRLMLLTADLGFMVWESFKEKFPQRFINVGVAEQNMLGLATGLAESGFLPFVYSIVTFATLRPYEFIRNGPILHQLPVRIVGVGGGYEYGMAGHTHHGLEDIAVMRTQPGIKIIVPADCKQTNTALADTYAEQGPIYYRLGKNNNLVIPELDGRFRLGKVETIRDGRDILWVTTGGITAEVVNAIDALSKKGIQSTLAIVSSLNPAPTDDLIELMQKFPLVITVETHYTTGGLGSLVCEIASEQNLDCRIIRKGVNVLPPDKLGSEQYYNKFYGLDAQSLSEFAKLELEHS